MSRRHVSRRPVSTYHLQLQLHGSFHFRALSPHTDREAVEATKGYLPAAAVFPTSPVALLWADASARGAARDGA